MDVATLAVLIGLANGALLLLKPIYRLHQRIDRNAERLDVLERQVRSHIDNPPED